MTSITETIPHPSAADATRTITPADVRRWLQDGSEIALLDVREHGQYGEGHPFFAVHVPYSRLELDIVRLVPRRATRIVLIDDADGRHVAERAARRLKALGYTGVHRLAGGAAAWRSTGASLFQGVNLPSKTFGEKIELAFHVPHISAAELLRRQQSGEPLVLLDGRTLEEHRKMTIPGAVPVPNGELALRWRSVVPDATTPIVVHCAGRTRSIVGAQILRDLGVPNPVVALENGTQGWALAGFALEHGSDRALPDAADASARQAARADSERAARREDVPTLTAQAAQAWLDDAGRTTFVVDVRTAAEFKAGSLAGAVNVPGGQLLQATDLAIGVRGSRVIVVDDDNVRAPLIALWLRRLGFDAALVVGGVHAGLTVPGVQAARVPALRRVESLGDPQAVLLDLRLSLAYRRGHAPGAVWSVRPRVLEDAERAAGGDRHRPLVLLFDDAALAALAASDLDEAGWLDVAGAPVAVAAGVRQESTPSVPSDAEAIDYLFFVHDRHEGNMAAARRYLEWETGLLAQCTADELGGFRLPV